MCLPLSNPERTIRSIVSQGLPRTPAVCSQRVFEFLNSFGYIKYRMKKIALITLFLFLAGMPFIFLFAQETKSAKTEETAKPAEQKKPKIGVGSENWLAILKAFEKHNDESKALLETFAKDKKNSLEKKLAEKLLQEWDIKAKEVELFDPVAIKYGKYRIIHRGTPRTSVVIVEMKVTAIGAVEDLQIVRSSYPNPPIKLDGLRASVFRPAFLGGKFVAGKHTFGIELAGR
ncbi:MAG: hypothetical protein A2Y62_17025 [Candidatus Fischerbacteria bacterium RBG_13_37_8]|uniref:Uncharacterized protein n=1 Tax=Candidatus Fischerbacteria bacterium RBG_13_37_8 TaxID=1817863 RepID=A0A1F5VFW3_9BACT|nr:MAG: hypothetical protein A2Y62_17025 [Candidatus Fischerbacteria bacterium RBG_13_37_8]